jgi:hypothetical protein
MHTYDKDTEFIGSVWYFPEFESILKSRTRSLARQEINEHGAVRATVRLTLENWNRIKGLIGGTIFENMRVSVVQLKLF